MSPSFSATGSLCSPINFPLSGLHVTIEEDNENPNSEPDDQPPIVAPSVKSNDSWKCGENWCRIIRPSIHHRFVLILIGKPLKTCTSSKHMIEVVSHAFLAHQQAYELCHIIHCDVNPNNILITSSGGILNDWDMTVKGDNNRQQDHRWYERTATSKFMSSLLLAGHHIAHTIQDDMESFVLIVLFHALRYFPHNKTEQTLRILNEVFNDQERLHTGKYVGGEARKGLFLHKDYIGQDFQLASPPLDRWVHALIKGVKEWIETELAKSDSMNNKPRSKMTVKERIAAYKASKHKSPVPLPAEAEPTPIPPRAFDDHEPMANSFAACLRAMDWPGSTDDKPYDILPDLQTAEKNRPAWMRTRFRRLW